MRFEVFDNGLMVGQGEVSPEKFDALKRLLGAEGFVAEAVPHDVDGTSELFRKPPVADEADR